MKKKILVIASVLTLAPATIFANGIKIWVNGNIVKSDVSPYIKNSRTMVPIRVISESLGKEVKWNGDEKKVNIKDSKGNEISLVIGEKFIKDESNNVDRKFELDSPAVIKDDRTFVPIRAIAEAFGEKVDWDKDNRTVIIGKGYKKPEPVRAEKTTHPLGLDYLYNKEMINKSDEEKTVYERKMREEESKLFPGHKNREVEAALAWLSFAKSNKFFQDEVNKDTFSYTSKNEIYYGIDPRGSAMSWFEDESKEEYTTRDFMSVNAGPSMAELEHFDYYLNYDGTFNSFRMPLHYHDTPEEMLKQVKKIISNPEKVKFIDANKSDIERLLKNFSPENEKYIEY
ncbi:copper amine oxidase N-terminal domain-containing protein [Peptoniphilus sp. MSJ-1]|uniref:Copper amine oxidase N-terminal domain-containing protein n=1 Tax=Peptoniphilus ovalis TaxID=2841503 RepID=A0ABS6FH14_9FIRM|nr:copper amine oxidase N-terminal domain-containing protein [Peptoniphilus ovalis]MBU5668551.1 copper amine oxidase N-terminal domain-containing protein [Peptoniphilus ovalis]